MSTDENEQKQTEGHEKTPQTPRIHGVKRLQRT